MLTCKFKSITIHSTRPALASTALLVLLGLIAPRYMLAEDGYELWLRYHPIESRWRDTYRSAAVEFIAPENLPAQRGARAELLRALTGLLTVAPRMAARPTRDGALIIGTPQSSPLIAALHLDLRAAGSEGYRIRSMRVRGHRAIVIAGNEDLGVLHGVFAFLRLLQTREPIDRLDLSSAPALPGQSSPRYTDYARACASIGLNGTVLTNVNASAVSLSAEYLRKAAALAGVLRPYGVRVYLSARFSAPIELGGLATADPLDARVRDWWRAKVDEIYRYIPDFGGFLVKANSEGQPGPQDYGRTHADGANLLAEALAPHGGVVMWRAFVYTAEPAADRAMQSYTEFKPLDGKFADNVLLQLKNGPIDFQPREPFHPLLGAMPGTPLMLEVQLTKEYLGFATHLAYLGPSWQEALESDTYAKGPGSTVRRQITGIAGVANIGADRNWTGSHFDQANWYVFGRLAWDPALSARAIAGEWVRMTFSSDSSQRPLPAGFAPPPHPLEYYESLRFPCVPGTPGPRSPGCDR